MACPIGPPPASGVTCVSYLIASFAACTALLTSPTPPADSQVEKTSVSWQYSELSSEAIPPCQRDRDPCTKVPDRSRAHPGQQAFLVMSEGPATNTRLAAGFCFLAFWRLRLKHAAGIQSHFAHLDSWGDI
ncbi:hypothetical protein LY78DRAFT_159758 [Colletotrichum sublineola]|nr:hypothetical protein LY78DRAFT_159758 [Colletotrichum sublineola]